MNKIIKYIIDSIFPNVCGICDCICKKDICNKCMIEFKKYKECRKHIYLARNFTTHIFMFRYEGLVKEKIISYKFSNKSYIYRSFGQIIINDKKICGFLKSYDIIIPVPISKRRNKKRGYNQSKLILDYIKKNLRNINIRNDILYKIRNTIPQSMLDKEKRKGNLKNAYIVKNCGKIKNKKVLLFDDIYTTGSTVDECSKMLKKAGAYEVGVLTLAKD